MATKIRPKINQNCTDFTSVQDIETMLACIAEFLRSANSNMLTKILREQKGVAIASKFAHTKTKMHYFSFVRDIVTTFTIGFLAVCYTDPLGV